MNNKKGLRKLNPFFMFYKLFKKLHESTKSCDRSTNDK